MRGVASAECFNLLHHIMCFRTAGSFLSLGPGLGCFSYHRASTLRTLDHDPPNPKRNQEPHRRRADRHKLTKPSSVFPSLNPPPLFCYHDQERGGNKTRKKKKGIKLTKTLATALLYPSTPPPPSPANTPANTTPAAACAAVAPRYCTNMTSAMPTGTRSGRGPATSSCCTRSELVCMPQPAPRSWITRKGIQCEAGVEGCRVVKRVEEARRRSGERRRGGL